MKVLRRYLLRQHAMPFFFAMTAITGFELVRQIARRLGDLLGKGLPWHVMVEFFALTVPFLVAITFSMSVLVAVLYTMSRMAGDRELTAMRAGGVSLGQIVRPLLGAATVVALVSFLFGDQLLPRTNHRLRSLMTDIYRTKPTFSLKEHVINEVQKGRTLLRAAQIDQATYRMRDVTLYSLEHASTTRIIYADSGRLAFAPNQTDLQLTLFDGAIHEFDRNDLRMFQQTAFQQQLVLVRGVGSEFVRRETDDFRGQRELSICQLERTVRAARRDAWIAERQADAAQRNALRSLVALPELAPDTTGAPTGRGLYCRALATLAGWFGPGELDAQETPQDSATRTLVSRFNAPARRAFEAGAVPRLWSSEVRVLRDRAESSRSREAVYQVELHKKYAIPAACVVFVLIGVPLAVRFPRGGVGLVIGAGLLVFGLYYVGLIGGETLADRGFVHPALAMWASNIVMAVLGVWELRRARLAGSAPRHASGRAIVRRLLRRRGG